MGPATLAAARQADAAAVVARLRADRLAFMSGLPVWRTFGKGWRARMAGLDAWGAKRPRVDIADAGSAFTSPSR